MTLKRCFTCYCLTISETDGVFLKKTFFFAIVLWSFLHFDTNIITKTYKHTTTLNSFWFQEYLHVCLISIHLPIKTDKCTYSSVWALTHWIEYKIAPSRRLVRRIIHECCRGWFAFCQWVLHHRQDNIHLNTFLSTKPNHNMQIVFTFHNLGNGLLMY